MKLTVNGEPHEGTEKTLEELLRVLGLDQRPCATMIDGRIVKRTERATTPLAENAQVEIISMVGGG